jgi:hypothetical protein
MGIALLIGVIGIVGCLMLATRRPEVQNVSRGDRGKTEGPFGYWIQCYPRVAVRVTLGMPSWGGAP